MTVNATVQVLEDSSRNFIVHLSALMQGGDAEVLAKKVDVSAMAKAARGMTVVELSLMEMRAVTTNVSISLICESLAPNGNAKLWTFPANFSGHQKFKDIGGLQNTAAAPSGNILISTENWADPQLDGGYDMTLWFRKKLSDVSASTIYSIASTLGGDYITMLGDTVTL